MEYPPFINSRKDIKILRLKYQEKIASFQFPKKRYTNAAQTHDKCILAIEKLEQDKTKMIYKVFLANQLVFYTGYLITEMGARE